MAASGDTTTLGAEARAVESSMVGRLGRYCRICSARACQVAGENIPQNRGRCERRFSRYDGSNYSAEVPPAFFGVVGSQGPPFSVTQLTSYFNPSPTAGLSNTR